MNITRKPQPDPSVSTEREYARHLAYRLLSEMAAALLESRPGRIGVPKVDPIFGAIVGRSLQLIADQVKASGAPASAEPIKQNPGDTNTGE
ncbi:hypothetical protein [Bifidobacterium sp.]|uniref:hypothetical protein n=2 Tax=Bifidobacterium sp. TaxID=41200 RepID=UPI0025BA869E|nr:hypothetical protein [Bifidobacterium sp.]MCI1224499.1 hypothetical protein [Bifidobacterium sp.]